MRAAMLRRLWIASDLQGRARKLEEAAVEYAMACEACHGGAVDASEWCGEDARAELEAVTEGLARRMQDARETARDLHKAASCIADGVLEAAVRDMEPDEAAELADAMDRSEADGTASLLDEMDRRYLAARRVELGLPPGLAPELSPRRQGTILLDLLEETADGTAEAPRSPAEPQTGRRGTSPRPDASEASSAVLGAPAGMSCGEAGAEAVHG